MFVVLSLAKVQAQVWVHSSACWAAAARGKGAAWWLQKQWPKHTKHDFCHCHPLNTNRQQAVKNLPWLGEFPLSYYRESRGELSALSSCEGFVTERGQKNSRVEVITVRKSYVRTVNKGISQEVRWLTERCWVWWELRRASPAWGTKMVKGDRSELIINRKVHFICDSFVFTYPLDWSKLVKIKFCYCSNIYNPCYNILGF